MGRNRSPHWGVKEINRDTQKKEYLTKRKKRFEWAKDKRSRMVYNCKNCTSKIDDTNIYLMPCNEMCKDVYSYWQSEVYFSVQAAQQLEVYLHSECRAEPWYFTHSINWKFTPQIIAATKKTRESSMKHSVFAFLVSDSTFFGLI